MAHTHEVMLQLEDINTKLTVLESNTRGYVISRNDSFIANYDELRQSIRAAIASVRQLTSDNPLQQQRISQIMPYIEKKIAFTEATVSHTASEGIELVSSGDGKRLMDTIREQLISIKETETSLLQHRMAASKELSDYVFMINVIITLLIVLVILGAVMFIFMDIDKRERLETEVRENESRLKQFFEALPMGITVRDAAGDLFFTNKQGRETLHNIFPESSIHNLQLLVKDQKVLKAGTDEIYPLEEMPVIQALSGHSSSVDNIEIRNRDKSILLSETASPVYNSKQEIVYAIAAFDDITNRKREEFELKQAKQAAEDSSLAKERFLANMSHEIRTPMNAILGFTNLLHRSPLIAEQLQFVDAIRSSGENLLTIINDILDVSKIQAGMMQLETIPFGLKPLFESLQVLLRNSAQEKGLKLTIECQDNVPWLLIGDPVRLTQIMYNLVQNAIKFTAKGEIAVNARVQKQEQDQCWIEIAVSDTGIGISQDKLDSIFERFSQATTATTREFGGTGLGLSIVKSLVELQGGKISIASTLGKGSVFSVLIPYKNASEEDISLYSEKSNLEEGVIQRHLHVLVTEDNVLNQKLAIRVLSDMGFSVEVASNGSEAVQLLQAGQRFDIILMDIQMPVMDGYEATRVIREELKIDIPIMAMTAHAMSGEKERCIAYGMNDYLSKPFKARELQSKIYLLLGTDALSPEAEFSTAAATPTVYDLSYLSNMAGGNIGFMKEMVGLFLTHTPLELKKLEQAVMQAQLTQVSEVAHKLKSSVAMMGIERMVYLLKELESQAHDAANPHIMKTLHEEIAKIGETALHELGKWVKTQEITVSS
ncbi:CHASE3 domain-containing protein [Pontibacter sp. JH31]|uniref:histidine kinase n=1 Tax=Pontibacter aquaedesilientis TaxID=2766980 RepID=A0ABR7XBH7_9BACT|nr:CHASE3 domain-containing protein [Pontibacter aquaedesilientis]